jgi:phage FluMu gp28-like protein
LTHRRTAQKVLVDISAVWQPHPGQREFLESEAKFKVLACGRRWGKTDACAASIVQAFGREHPTRHLIIAPTLDQAKLLFDRVETMLYALGLKPNVRKSPHPRLISGEHVLMARSGFLGRALRGNEATHIVVDEAAFVPKEIIEEVAMPMLATTGGHLTLISTPRGTNHFWEYFRMGQEGRHGIWSRRAPTAESPFVSHEFLRIQRDLISERAFRVEYEAEFLDASGRVFKGECIDACLVPRLPSEPRPPFMIGVDWARYSDYTAVAVLSGTKGHALLVELDRFTNMRWQDQIERVAGLIGRFPGAQVVCDATGSGDMAVEMLRARLPGFAIRSLVFTNEKKAELVRGLEWLIEGGGFAMTPHPDLIRELQHFEATTSEAGNIRYGAVTGYHDDLVIALALAASELRDASRPAIVVGGSRRFSAEGKEMVGMTGPRVQVHFGRGPERC